MSLNPAPISSQSAAPNQPQYQRRQGPDDRSAMQMCLTERVQEMNDPGKCLGFMINHHQNHPEMTIGELKQQCDMFNNQTTIGLYQNLCQGEIDNYRRVFAREQQAKDITPR